MRPLLEVSDQEAEICLLLWLKTFPPGANVDNSGARSFRVLSACWTFRRSQDQKGNRRGSGGCGLFKHPPKLMAHEDARPGRSRLAAPFTCRGSGHSSRLQQEPSSSRGTGWQLPQPWPVNHRWWQPAVAGLWSHGAGRRPCPAQQTGALALAAGRPEAEASAMSPALDVWDQTGPGLCRITCWTWVNCVMLLQGRCSWLYL